MADMATITGRSLWIHAEQSWWRLFRDHHPREGMFVDDPTSVRMVELLVRGGVVMVLSILQRMKSEVYTPTIKKKRRTVVLGTPGLWILREAVDRLATRRGRYTEAERRAIEIIDVDDIDWVRAALAYGYDQNAMRMRWHPIMRKLKLYSIAAEAGRTPSAVHRVARAKAASLVEAKTKGVRERKIRCMLGFIQAVSPPNRPPWNPWLVRRTLAWWPSVDDASVRRQAAKDLGYNKIYVFK